MRTKRLMLAGAAAAGLGGGLAGCQTQVAGMTLPSPRYLEHYPQYFSPDPTFPLPRELASQTDPAGLAAGAGVGPGVGPAPVAPAAPVPGGLTPPGGGAGGPAAPGANPGLGNPR